MIRRVIALLCSAKLTEDQVAYCVKHMKPIPNQPGHYDYKEFAETVRANTLALYSVSG